MTNDELSTRSTRRMSGSCRARGSGSVAIAADDETATTLGVACGARTRWRSPARPAELDLVIVATCTRLPDAPPRSWWPPSSGRRARPARSPGSVLGIPVRLDRPTASSTAGCIAASRHRRRGPQPFSSLDRSEHVRPVRDGAGRGCASRPRGEAPCDARHGPFSDGAGCEGSSCRPADPPARSHETVDARQQTIRMSAARSTSTPPARCGNPPCRSAQRRPLGRRR